MNTKASVAYGWGILCLAGGGAYYFAKRSINADREERAMAEEHRRQQRERQRITESVSRNAKLSEAQLKKKARAPNAEKSGHKDPAPGDLTHGKPGGETVDPAPVDHAEESESKFEAKVPFRSKKGDRFS
ncbi:hypothetical protein LTR37_011979 [Vermiconidia calcicola]|uniref:Uncharacterized protein n=1 Tax=Vermiconidia calcicola TaxID=1690605 RepID=A0ACC3N0G2_9PEZI|nr:hypothetical protein LTR37_011979 [Vermiconidia calcicola]